MNVRTSHPLTIFFIFCCLSYAASLKAFEQSYQIKVVTEYLEPYQIKNKDGSLGGFSTDVIKALFKQANSTANIQVMPWARAYQVAQAEKDVMIYSIAHTPMREDLFQWVGSLKEERLFFWGLKSQFPLPIPTLALLKGYRIAASRQSNVAQYLADNNFFNVRELIHEEQNMHMLYRGRVDLIVATEATVKLRTKKLGLDFTHMIKVHEAKELNNDLCIGFNLDSEPELVKHFQQAYQALKARGIVDQYKEKWGLSEQP